MHGKLQFINIMSFEIQNAGISKFETWKLRLSEIEENKCNPPPGYPGLYPYYSHR
jgi:hypothetical protein